MCGVAAPQRAELCSLIAAKGVFVTALCQTCQACVQKMSWVLCWCFHRDNSSWSRAAEALAWEWLLGASLGSSWRAGGCSCQDPALPGGWKRCTEPLARMSLGTVLSLRQWALISPVTAWGLLGSSGCGFQRAFQINLQPDSSFHFQGVPPLPFQVISYGAITHVVFPIPSKEAI